MHLSPIGELVSRAWREIPAHHPVMHIDAFVVMPNHVHGILFREEAVGAKHASPLHRPGTVSGSLPAVVQSFKSAASRFAAATGETSGARLWQRGFHEHVLRTEADLARLRRYIMENPLRWALDRENPDREES
jgi:REP element-mobilizing transposase RayT